MGRSVLICFVCFADHAKTIHEITRNRTNKAASCGFVDRFSASRIAPN